MKTTSHNIVLFRIFLAVAVSAILILATTPRSLPVVSGMNDKLNHIAAFFALAFLADFSFPEKKFPFAVLFPLMGYGLAIEVIQYYLPHRMFSLFDLAGDAVGLLLYRFSLPVIKKSIDAVFNKK